MAIRSKFPSFLLVVTDIRTDGHTDIRTDKASYRDARTHLIKECNGLLFSPSGDLTSATAKFLSAVHVNEVCSFVFKAYCGLRSL